MTIWVAAAGNSTDLMTWSGIPAHLVEWAREAGLDFQGLPLRRAGEARRRLWNGLKLATTGRYGGFQYAPTFLEHLWRGWHERLRDQDVLNCYQVYPDSIIDDPRVRKWFHIDGTLHQLFFEDGPKTPLPKRVTDDALAREKRGFEAAEAVFCHSDWAAESVRTTYGIHADKVRVAVPGANLPIAPYCRFRATQAEPHRVDGPLRLVFVGRYWDRKGLDRLLEAIIIAQARGAGIALRVIGCRREQLPPHLQAVPDVDWAGSIEKRNEADRFFAAVSWAEIGCLLSRNEFGGIVLREFLALGMLSLAPDVQGSPEHAGPGATLVGPEEGAESIAEKLVVLAQRDDTYCRLRRAAWEARDTALWTVPTTAIAGWIKGRPR